MRLALLLVFASLLPPTLTSATDEPKLPIAPIAATPEARERFDALVAAYRALPAYADQGEVVVVTQVNDQAIRQTSKARIAFVRPDQLDVETDLVRVLSDGKNRYRGESSRSRNTGSSRPHTHSAKR